MVISTITYNYAGIFSQQKLFDNYTDIFEEQSFPFLLYMNVMNTSYAKKINFKYYADWLDATT